jgi:hypothetical protein
LEAAFLPSLNLTRRESFARYSTQENDHRGVQGLLHRAQNWQESLKHTSAASWVADVTQRLMDDVSGVVAAARRERGVPAIGGLAI